MGLLELILYNLIVKNKLKDVPHNEDLDIDRIVKITDGFNGADVAHFCEKLKDLAISRELRTGVRTNISNEDVTDASQMVFSSVSVEDLKKIAKYQETLNR